jgi:predicted small lipoprotein YifL
MSTQSKLYTGLARAGVLGLLTLSAACGVKGDLEAPPGLEGARPRGEILYPPGGDERAPESKSESGDETPQS